MSNLCQYDTYTIEPEVYLIFGGTGSLGRALLSRLLSEKTNSRRKIYIFSRDEAKHHKIKLDYPNVCSIIGDVRNYDSVLKAINETLPDVIINAAAMKQVPICEEYPYESVLTNVDGTNNIVRAVEAHCRGWHKHTLKVLSISTDKACKPVNSYGMTKALQERIHLRANAPTKAIHNCVRYGNVLESTGSVIPVFKKFIAEGKDLPITDARMTRFLLSLDEAVNLIFRALKDVDGGKIFIPKVKSSKMIDLASSLSVGHNVGQKIVGIRPGEKLHEILISEEETWRTEDRGDIFVIHDINTNKKFDHIHDEYSSGSSQCLMDAPTTFEFLREHGIV